MNEATHERKKLKWFLGFVLVILLLTAGSDLIMTFYGNPEIPKNRNPFVTVPTTIPTPFFTPQPTASSTAFPSITQNPTVSPTPVKIPTGAMIMCPMDAKECPDGTFVGRGGPNCEFIACPK